MFAPEDYFTWEFFSSEISDWCSSILRARILEENPDYAFRYIDGEFPLPSLAELPDAGLAASMGEAIFIYGLLHTWLTARFMYCFPPQLCSPTGTVLQSSRAITAHADRLEHCTWTWPLDTDPSFSSFFDLRKEHGLEVDELYEQFCAIDVHTGLVVKKNDTNMLLGQALGRPQLSDRYSKLIDPFVGWAICWRENVLPDASEKLFRTLRIPDEEAAIREYDILFREVSEVESNQPKRQTRALSAIYQAFPSGKGQATWDFVASRTGYTRTHIERVLRSEGLLQKWKAGEI